MHSIIIGKIPKRSTDAVKMMRGFNNCLGSRRYRAKFTAVISKPRGAVNAKIRSVAGSCLPKVRAVYSASNTYRCEYETQQKRQQQVHHKP